VTDRRKTEVKDSLAYPLLEELLEKIPSKYDLVLLAALRAKQIITNQKRGLNADGEYNPDLKAMQTGRKPLSIALMEIQRGELPREKIFLLEYLESFRRGDEEIQPPRIENPIEFTREHEAPAALPEYSEPTEDEIDIEEI
jgi:DNA-directed RNA polymerase omega subunit